MKTLIHLIIGLLLFVWQLPQCLVGIGVILFYVLSKKDIRYQDGIAVVKQFPAGGVSLGEFIIIHHYCDDEETRKHELGHRRQSRMLGPLYLFVVGIPSVCLCLLAKKSKKINSTYYEHFPENWANKLGGVGDAKLKCDSEAKENDFHN